MNKEQILAAWSPDVSPWAPWVKTVLFAHLEASFSGLPGTDSPPEASWVPAPEDRYAIVVDLPGAEGVLAGIALAQQGYRPVPLYNALPLPAGCRFVEPMNGKTMVAVDVTPIIVALEHGANILASLGLPADAPPAFLLNSNRHGDGHKISPEEFDNRSICFPTDFPSANYLQTHGLRRVLLIQKNLLEPQPDLTHVLRRWQDGGLPLARMRTACPAQPEPFNVPRPTWYGQMFQRALAALGLRRASTGGFGAWMPESSSGG